MNLPMTMIRQSDELSASEAGPIDLARDAHDLIADEAAEAEAQGRLTDKTVTALMDRSLFQILLPRRWGGHACGVETYFRVIETLAHADGAAGWCVALCNSNNELVFRGLGLEGREAVFGSGPVAVWGALQPKGLSEEVEGGYRISGSWGWGSGSAQAKYVEVQTLFQTESGAPWMRVHVVPKDQTQIDAGSWNVLGLRATSSIDYKLDNVFVPKCMTFEYPLSAEMFLTRKLVEGKQIETETGGALRAVDHAAVGLAGLSGWASGVATRALDELVEKASQIYRLTGSGNQADDAVVQLGLAEADGKLRSARSAMLSLLKTAEEIMAQGGTVDTDLRVDIFQAGLVLTRAAREAVIFAYDNAGSSVVYARNPIQRCLRDIFTGLKHGAASPGVFTRVGKARLGLEGVGL